MTIRDPSPAPPTVQPPTVQPPTAGPAAPRPAVALHVADEAVAVREALALTLPSDGGRVAALLTAGPGVRAEALRQRLRAALSADPRVTLATVTTAPGAPVADPGVAGGHVNTVATVVSPRPDVVVGASEHAGTLYLVGSDPGPDGLGGGAAVCASLCVLLS